MPDQMSGMSVLGDWPSSIYDSIWPAGYHIEPKKQDIEPKKHDIEAKKHDIERKRHDTEWGQHHIDWLKHRSDAATLGRNSPITRRASLNHQGSSVIRSSGPQGLYYGFGASSHPTDSSRPCGLYYSWWSPRQSFVSSCSAPWLRSTRRLHRPHWMEWKMQTGAESLNSRLTISPSTFSQFFADQFYPQIANSKALDWEG
jgi:hypothetical protein